MAKDGSISKKETSILKEIKTALRIHLQVFLSLREAEATYAEFNATFDSLTKLLEEAMQSAHPRFLLAAEKMILEFEHDEFPQISQALKSSLAALDQISEVEAALRKREENPREYHEQANISHPSSRKKNGLPLDVCRVFAVSHVKRLENKLTNSHGMSGRQAAFIDNRVDMLRNFEARYIDWQCEAVEEDETA